MIFLVIFGATAEEIDLSFRVCEAMLASRRDTERRFHARREPSVAQGETPEATWL